MKPEFFLLGEVIHGEYARWVNPETLHSVTNYELHKSIYSGFNSHNFFEIAHNVNRNQNIARDLYTFLENHDVDRIASKLENKKNLYPAYMCLFTLPGKPSIYYGGEFGMEGKKQGNDDRVLRPALSEDAMEPNELTSYIAKLAEILEISPSKLLETNSCPVNSINFNKEDSWQEFRTSYGPV